MNKSVKRKKKKNFFSAPMVIALFLSGLAAVFVQSPYFSSWQKSGFNKSVGKQLLHNYLNQDRIKAEKKAQLREDSIDHYLKDVQAKRKYRSAQVEVENFYYAPEIDDFKALREQKSEYEEGLSYGVAMDQSLDGARVQQELGRDSIKDSRFTPDEIINARIIKKQDDDEYNSQFREAYVNAFVENARDAGYRVDVDDNMMVKNVQRLKKKQETYIGY